MRTQPRSTAVVTALLSVVVALGAAVGAGLLSPAAAGGGGHHGHHGHHWSPRLVVDTQFTDAPSPVVRGTGPFRSCDSVANVFGDGFDLGFTTAFFGLKEVTCDKGVVILSYSALLSTDGEEETRGFWTVLVSTLPGVAPGDGGPLFGDPDRCEDLTGEGCIRDVFVLR